jgi:hypothetical protein
MDGYFIAISDYYKSHVPATISSFTGDGTEVQVFLALDIE